jgi:hypothetical protein
VWRTTAFGFVFHFHVFHIFCQPLVIECVMARDTWDTLFSVWCSSLIGGMSMKRRAEALECFRNNEDVPVFLLNKQCGAMGVNLTVATHVLILEASWNPVWEEQAISRAHRLGQKGPIQVIRYIGKGACAASLEIGCAMHVLSA